jgi:hypothetical protein
MLFPILTSSIVLCFSKKYHNLFQNIIRIAYINLIFGNEAWINIFLRRHKSKSVCGAPQLRRSNTRQREKESSNVLLLKKGHHITP